LVDTLGRDGVRAARHFLGTVRSALDNAGTQ
jgi:hypothetical protein